jgi:hypothetical protein
MNERIKELAHKADFINKRNNGDEWRWGYIDPELAEKLEKFAELIVKECADVIQKEVSMKYARSNCDEVDTEEFMAGYYAGSLLARVKINQHFGVDK